MGHPTPLVNGQQAHTQAVAVETVTVVFADGSPEPWSPSVSCHGVGPSSNPGSAVAESDTVPVVTQIVCADSVEAAPPATETEHQDR